MRLTTTRKLITDGYGCTDWFDQVYPNIGPDQEVDLLDMINNDCISVDDVVWLLDRATKQGGLSVYNELVKRHAERKNKWREGFTRQPKNREAAQFWADDLVSQRQDLIELLS
jgi:hypothetical protein